MKRTQIYLETNLYDDLRIGARMLNISVAEYIRKLLSKEVYLETFADFPPPVTTSLAKIAKKAVSFGKKNLAQNFDAYFEKSLR